MIRLLRLAFTIPLLLLAFAASLIEKIGHHLLIATTGLAFGAKVATLFILNLPRYLFNAPSNTVKGVKYLWSHKGEIASSIGKTLHANRHGLFGGLVLGGVAVGLSFATFGVAPIIMGVAGGTAFLSTLLVSRSPIGIKRNPYVQALMIGLLVLATATAVYFTLGAGIPFIVTLLPFVLPTTTLGMQIGIATGIGALATLLPSLASGLINFGKTCFTSGEKLASKPAPDQEQSGQPLLEPKINKSQPHQRYAVLDGDNSYQAILSTQQKAQQYCEQVTTERKGTTQLKIAEVLVSKSQDNYGIKFLKLYQQGNQPLLFKKQALVHQTDTQTNTKPPLTVYLPSMQNN